MEDRRRQSVNFENVAKEMLKCLENSEELNVGITEVQEHLEVPVQMGITLQQVAQQARNNRNQKVLKSFGKKKKKKSHVQSAGQGGMHRWSWKEVVRT